MLSALLLQRDISPAITERSSWFLVQQWHSLAALRSRQILGYLLTLSVLERPVIRISERTYLQTAFPAFGEKYIDDVIIV